MALPTGGYSFTPQVANLGASPLSALKPLDVGVSVQFTPMPKYEVPSAQQELVSMGAAKGFQGLVEPVFAALKAKEEKKQADADLVKERAHEVMIANIKAAPTEAEKAYALLKSNLTQKQIEATDARVKEATEGIDNTAVEAGEFDFKQFENFLKPVPEAPIPVAKPVSATVPTSATSVSQFAPSDAGRGLFQFDRTTPIDASGNVIPTKENTGIIDTSTQPNLFSNINLPVPQQPDSGYRLAPSRPREAQLPEIQGTATLEGVSFPLASVTGAEEKPLAGTPPIIETPLPEAQPELVANLEPASQAELTQDQYKETKYQIENQLTARPYKSIADARRAKQILEQALGGKVQITTEKGEKGSRLHYVEITEEPESPMETIPKDMVMKQVVDKDGQLTTTYVPKVPIKQQVATFDNNIEKARVLKTTIEKIEKIAPGYLFAGAGGVSGIMQYNPFSNDARTVRKLVDTVKGIVGFDELVALKAAGGSLGALSDSELSMLTSLKGSVDPDLDEATFLSNIKSIKESADKLISGLEADKKELINVEKQTKFQPIQTPKSEPLKKGDEFYNPKTKQTLIWDGNSYISK
jgi:hypothetical protein